MYCLLTDTQIKKTKSAEKAFKLSDSGGLFLLVAVSGSKIWKLKYRFNGKEKQLDIGHYPTVSLSDARKARDDAKALLKEGRDPSVAKQLDKLSAQRSHSDKFEAVAREWHALQKPQWVDRHADDVITSLEKDVFPHIGKLPIREITSPIILGVIRLIEKRGAIETGRRIRQRISHVFTYAIGAGMAETDPASAVANALAPMKKGRHPALTDLYAARQMLRSVEQTPGHPATKLAIRLLALTFLRPGPFSETPWWEINQVDPADPVWIVPAARMKLKKEKKDDGRHDHMIPLSRQAMETIAALRLLTGKGIYMFPNGRSTMKPMSENAMGYMLNRAGYHHKHVPHGFRTTFSTVMNELYPADRAVIDLMLAHIPKDKTESAYNRALHLERRKELSQMYADILMEGAPSALSLLDGPRKILNPESYRKVKAA